MAGACWVCCCQHSPVKHMNVRIFWISAMECMCAQARPWFILSLERVWGNRFRNHVNSKGKMPSTRGSEKVQTCNQGNKTSSGQLHQTLLYHPDHGSIHHCCYRHHHHVTVVSWITGIFDTAKMCMIVCCVCHHHEYHHHHWCYVLGMEDIGRQWLHVAFDKILVAVCHLCHHHEYHHHHWCYGLGIEDRKTMTLCSLW